MSNLPASLESLAGEILRQNPVHAEFLQSSLAAISDEALSSLHEYVEYCLARELTIDYLARCYNTIVNDTLAEQFFFMKHGRYRFSRYAEVAQKVYLDDEYMKKYMYGLALTAFLWPNHLRLYEFFVRTFPRAMGGRYLEVGPGHGYYLRRAAELGRFDELVGVDISPTSVALTRDILAYSGVDRSARVRIVRADFLEVGPDESPYDCIVMGEVLEHVEEPERFLGALAARSAPESHVFVTTCVNAPAVDHIYLFRRPQEVEAMIERCGFTIAQACRVPMVGKTLEECARAALPVNVAYVLRKA